MGCRCSRKVLIPTEDASSNLAIHRLAIDQSACIGSLYNAREDYLLKNPVLEVLSTSITVMKETYETVVDTGKLQDKNLTKILIGIDKELCLSIYLNLVDQNGISLLLECPFVINKYTRFLSYYYRTKQNLLNNQSIIIRPKTAFSLVHDITGTHLVTGIKFGVHVIVVLQISPKYESELDHLLTRIKYQLATNRFQLQSDEEVLFDYITEINVFSNIPDIAKLTKLTDVCRKLTEIVFDIPRHPPLEYILTPIRSFLPSDSMDKKNFYSLKEESMDQLTVYFYLLLLVRKSLKTPIDSEGKQTLQDYLVEQYDQVQQQISSVDELYQERIIRKRELILKIRSGTIEKSSLNEPLVDDLDTLLLDKACEVNDSLNALKAKIQLINRLSTNRITYCNVKTLAGQEDEHLETVEQKLLEKSKDALFFCFDDKLGKTNASEREALYSQLMDESRKSSQRECIYADFTYCACHLSERRRLSASTRLTTNHLDQPESIAINVLLLGESGVGKSTFINALANYLVFDSLVQARTDQPVALIPVSFLMTAGDNFEETIVRFGDKDPNEDHHHSGQSVTQKCRSYVFTIDAQTTLRLIDTPGMGDTRGLDQDDLNMQHILSFISNLSHLSAICILLKPNESRLNVVFRSYFTRLVGFLGDHVHNNIIFCFTSARATFFAPGNTGPLLRKMLQSQSIKDIPFDKTNTFCFDSESFRYLIALLNKIEFDDHQKEDYERSWVRSVNESNRFLEYIRTELKPYLQVQWQSIEHAQFQITLMTRPMLETLRNLFRNRILRKEKSSQLPIELLPKKLSAFSTICLQCLLPTQCLSNFVVVPDDLHTFLDKCENCNCSREDHMNIDYKLEYGNSNDTNEEFWKKMSLNLDELKGMILKLGRFFVTTAPDSENDDPILRTLPQMIIQENRIRSLDEGKYLNSKLCGKLQRFNDDYKQERNNAISNGEAMSLATVYEIIQTISAMESIKKQIDTGEQCRQEFMRKQEKEMSCKLRLNST